MKPIVLVLAAALPWLSGCAATAPYWEDHFGDAARQARAAQVIDPNAPSRRTVAQGIDGKAAAGVMKTYAESYGYGVKEAKQPALSISTTGGR
jgi:hypothetical protein